MAELKEIKYDLFKSKLIGRPGVAILHCVSSDYALGAGFAKLLDNKYNVKIKLRMIGGYSYPDSIYVDGIINMVTKGAYWSKPTYDTFVEALRLTVGNCQVHGIHTLIMPRIGCGLDKLDWKICKEHILKILVGNGINCIVYTI